jgi:hypothetical protein
MKRDEITIQNFLGRHIQWSMVLIETEVSNSCSHNETITIFVPFVLPFIQL